jgi:hypothetical protein
MSKESVTARTGLVPEGDPKGVSRVAEDTLEQQPNEMRLVRKGGLEPPRSCERQPLKLVRLPIPPLPQADDARERNPAPLHRSALLR